MSYKRILTIQDISCVGQCSLTVALPIISACGIETAILPSALLSTHTAGFTGFTFCDLTEEIPGILSHWKKEGILFDALYTGYLGSVKQISYVLDIADAVLKEGAPLIVDPAMADNGKLYPIFNSEYVEAMKKLVSKADIILPNITEACFLTDTEYREDLDEPFVKGLHEKLTGLGTRSVVLTGVGYAPEETGVSVFSGGTIMQYTHKKYAEGCHGTGDVYASAFTAAFMKGIALYDSAAIAADYTVKCIEVTKKDTGHWYGVEFERVIPELIERIAKAGI